MSQAVGKVDSRLEEQLRKLTEHAENNIENFNKALGKQQDALEKKLNQTEVLISEIQHLSAIKEGISKFEKATKEQSQKIDNLTRSIEKLAEIKSVGATHIHKTINWKRLLIWLVPTVVAAFMIFTLLILLLIANWDTFYYNFISKFSF
jgi:wobble nucleotide-excising tRNase